jgi:hypothetical protein
MCRSFLGHGTWKVKNGIVVFLSRSVNWLNLSENKTCFQNHFTANKLQHPCNISSLNTFTHTHTHTHREHYFVPCICILFKILGSNLCITIFCTFITTVLTTTRRQGNTILSTTVKKSMLLYSVLEF